MIRKLRGTANESREGINHTSPNYTARTILLAPLYVRICWSVRHTYRLMFVVLYYRPTIVPFCSRIPPKDDVV